MSRPDIDDALLAVENEDSAALALYAPELIDYIATLCVVCGWEDAGE